MYGKYVDQRVYQHFVHTYSKVPYLDREIYNVQTDALRLSRRADKRLSEAQEGIFFNIKELTRLWLDQDYFRPHLGIPVIAGKLKQWNLWKILDRHKKIASKNKSFFGANTHKKERKIGWAISKTSSTLIAFSNLTPPKLIVAELQFEDGADCLYLFLFSTRFRNRSKES